MTGVYHARSGGDIDCLCGTVELLVCQNYKYK